ncbi:MAG: hypothetical protein ACRDXB_07565, partial [Actinomycetes bacterium]
MPRYGRFTASFTNHHAWSLVYAGYVRETSSPLGWIDYSRARGFGSPWLGSQPWAPDIADHERVSGLTGRDPPLIAVDDCPPSRDHACVAVPEEIRSRLSRWCASRVPDAERELR